MLIRFGLVALRGVAVAFGVVVASFALILVIPGDPVSALLGSHVTPATAAALREQLGLDHPWWVRLGDYLGHVVTGDLGTSLSFGSPVASLIAGRVWPTLLLVLCAMVLAIVTSLALAVAAVRWRNGPIDHLVRLLTTTGMAIPGFWLGMLLILVFSVNLRWLPAGGVGEDPGSFIASLVLPSIVAAVAIVPVLSRSLRSQMIDLQDADFIVAARASGFSRRFVLWRRLVPNSLLPMLALAGTNFAVLLGGTFIVERVFSINGVGSLLFDAISARDAPLIQGIVLITGLCVVVITTLTDLLASIVDPRLRHERNRA
ncbi:ABC transporter permease [Plantibacter sp. Mn2098]|uniref:ABC transporter permease n=1 Tax=Plantibacter sp. Mn2098 TaxID=3395266 RepID=UPI003BC42F7D